MKEKLWVAEYSIIQKCRHICRLEDALWLNATMMLRENKVQPQYAIIFIGNSIQECHDYLDLFEERMRLNA